MALFTVFYNCCDDKHELIKTCHKHLLALYPGLHLRWVHIYGKRWAHFYGDTGEISCQPLKLQINNDYGICIDNPHLVPETDRQEIIASLEKCFK